MMPNDPRVLRDAFGAFMTGVTVVTACGPDGAPIGFTANSFTSVSLDPPLLLVCLANSSRNYTALTTAPGFAVNILAETQKAVSNTLGRPVEDRFAEVDWRRGPHGSPIIAGVSAWFDCSTHRIVDAGDHAILIGRGEAFDATPAPGLGYVRGAYGTPVQEAEALAGSVDVVVSALIERAGEVLLWDDGRGGLTVPMKQVGKAGATAALGALIAEAGVEACPGFIYSVFEDQTQGKQHISFLCKAEAGVPAVGAFTALEATALAGVADPAVRVMLQRLAEESRLGNYGIYFGNQNAGEVRQVREGGKA